MQVNAVAATAAYSAPAGGRGEDLGFSGLLDALSRTPEGEPDPVEETLRRFKAMLKKPFPELTPGDYRTPQLTEEQKRYYRENYDVHHLDAEGRMLLVADLWSAGILTDAQAHSAILSRLPAEIAAGGVLVQAAPSREALAEEIRSVLLGLVLRGTLFGMQGLLEDLDAGKWAWRDSQPAQGGDMAASLQRGIVHTAERLHAVRAMNGRDAVELREDMEMKLAVLGVIGQIG